LPAAPSAEKLPAVAGIDMTLGLQRTGGQVARYFGLLRTFVQSEAGAVGRARAAFESGDLATARREMHTLKGLAGSLGAVPLAAAAGAVEAAIAGEAWPTADMDSLERTLAQVVAGIGEALAAAPTTPADVAPGGDPASIVAALTRLKHLLETDDGEAWDFVLDTQADLARVLSKSDLDGLARLVGDFDFAAALSCLASICHRLSLTLE
jgi:two-component system sensor histidine kinase/response regulator